MTRPADGRRAVLPADVILTARLSKRVVDCLPKVLRCQVSVSLRDPYVRMTEDALDQRKADTVLHEPRSAGVPQRVKVNPVGELCEFDVVLEPLAHVGWAQLATL